ncbi:2,3-bisphosphoglycerate-independent phosphoglycerate mutase [Candidatus Aminicenantes bacterium AC-335-K20]|jgi:2,3-bisphosphoglycerate-independent phosphoglycerate mutase|nr:2,3-bisphosphoglycerate-independent phosphoglycerate mutase [SCandidatus Aminicenantes bacterium Aminicenantia_JdfR_composite]MCP2597897.1 2,3-bisphosphoglycerate-independent phosphoglycerate mutase [Candidatus Aminicenantes bacterium AC-335-L06]MCP2619452.1 2,3-bisphosphoglycerate-independent phosphoglycerate mutase [Candidatus Aminicenantes bacterium AC-335-K20]
MEREEIFKEIAIKTDSKIILIVIDGLGGLPSNGKTELEVAKTPNLDRLAQKSICGLSDPVFMGITPGSGPAHLALFGYDPTKYILGRGILEALGIGVEVREKDMVARGNFATFKDGMIIDRRAGRIPTEKNKEICKLLNQNIKEIENIKITLYPGKEHRFVLKLEGDNLSDYLTDADPQKENLPIKYTSPLKKEAEFTARIVNKFMDKAMEVLKDSYPANAVLLRGFSKLPKIPNMQELFKLNPLGLANYPMYKGLARLVGMKVLDSGQDIESGFKILKDNYPDYDFFYFHIKKTDSYGEDGNFKEKVRYIEKIDKFIPDVLSLNPDVLVITSDHSTPSLLKSHSWHPNPFLLYSKNLIPDKVQKFTELECAQGMLGRFQAINALPLMLAHALKLKKFGA